MPWKKFATDWLEALTYSYDASFLGTDKNNSAVICTVEAPIPQNKVLRLKLPCGQTIKGRPVWLRPTDEKDTSSLVAFAAVDLGLNKGDIEKVKSAAATRGSPRIPIRLWTSFPSEPLMSTVTRDLSLEGCCIEGDFREKLGKTLILLIELPDSAEPIKVKARVAWVKQDCAGLHFINIHSADEVRILRTLGQTTVPPSKFVPDAPAPAAPFSYRLTQSDSTTRLCISITNWDIYFDLKHARIEGPMNGYFARFHAFDSGLAIQALRTRLKLDLKRRKNFIHLLLLNEADELILSVVAEEVGFHRERRQSEDAFRAKECAS